MKGVSVMGYWKSRGYEQLDRNSRLGGSGSTRRRRLWRIKIGGKLKLKMRFSPKKVLNGICDAYVKMMVKFANSRVIVSNGAGDGFGSFGSRPLKEYDEKVIIELYKSIMMSHKQVDASTSQQQQLHFVS